MLFDLTRANTQRIILITVTFKIISTSSFPCFEHLVIYNAIIIIINNTIMDIFMYKAFLKKNFFFWKRSQELTSPQQIF